MHPLCTHDFIDFIEWGIGRGLKTGEAQVLSLSKFTKSGTDY
jgi:hypothetical protein